MTDLQELEKKLEKIEEKLADAEGRMPAHSVRPLQMAALFELEEERNALLAEIKNRRSRKNWNAAFRSQTGADPGRPCNTPHRKEDDRMSDGKFEKVTRSGKTLYGPRKLVLCGFSAGLQANFNKVLAHAGLQGIETVWASADRADDTIGRLIELPTDTGAGTDSTLPRAIIVAGISESELHDLMDTCRASGMKQALWAVLTPVSEKWPLRQLVAELEAERRALQDRQ